MQKLLFCFFILTLSGCAATSPKKVIMSYPTSVDGERSIPQPALCSKSDKQNRVQIYFPKNLYVAEDFEVKDATDPKGLVLFAVKMTRKQKFSEAATFFQEAADLYKEDNSSRRFKLACLGAAAVCWLKAGDEEHFHTAVAGIRRGLDRFQQADLANRYSVLFAISDRLKGGPARLNTSLPQSIKTLFEPLRRLP